MGEVRHTVIVIVVVGHASNATGLRAQSSPGVICMVECGMWLYTVECKYYTRVNSGSYLRTIYVANNWDKNHPSHKL
jgi:hypothetical protein